MWERRGLNKDEKCGGVRREGGRGRTRKDYDDANDAHRVGGKKGKKLLCGVGGWMNEWEKRGILWSGEEQRRARNGKRKQRNRTAAAPEAGDQGCCCQGGGKGVRWFTICQLALPCGQCAIWMACKLELDAVSAS